MSLLDELKSLSSAEEFFARLDVPFDQRVVHVARLHILRRMGEYLRGSEAEGVLASADDATLHALCATHLARAYADFVASSPIAERVFKVHRDAIAPRPAPNRPFVPLSALGVISSQMDTSGDSEITTNKENYGVVPVQSEPERL